MLLLRKTADCRRSCSGGWAETAVRADKASAARARVAAAIEIGEFIAFTPALIAARGLATHWQDLRGSGAGGPLAPGVGICAPANRVHLTGSWEAV